MSHKSYYVVARSAKTGRFVKLAYARRYPKTTVTERRKK
jgi:hypothetical protein